MLRVNEKLVQVSSRTGMRGKRIPTRPGKSWVKTRPERLADSKLPLALAKVEERKYAEDYTKATWDPLSGRAPRPAAGSDGQFEHTHFMSQDNVSPSMDRSAWELGFEGAAEMYPDSPVEDQPDIWIVRRIQPKYNPRLVNRKGWYDGYIYKDHEKTLIYESEHRLPAKVQSILHEMNLLNINDISVQFNTAEVNDLLWEVKSYVSIMPLRMPDGLPETEIDLENFRLLSTGELVNSALRLPKERILNKNISSGDKFSRYPILKAREAIFNPTCKGNKAKGRYKRLGITQNWNR